MNPSESGAIFSPGVRSLANDEDMDAADELDRILLEAEHLPYAVVSYTRKPYFYRLDRNVRVTIDTDIRALVPSDYLNSGTNVGLSILPAHMAIVEIKFYWAMPHWLRTLATNSGLQLRRFSKYASALEAIYPSITSRSLRLANFR